MITVDETRALRSAATVRAWTAGRQLAEILNEHQVRAARVTTTVWRSARIAGTVELMVRTASAADLLRLARCSGAELHTCRGAGEDREQAYIDLLDGPTKIQAHWAGTVSS